MARAIEDALVSIISLPASGPAAFERRRALIAIAQGVIGYLQRNAPAITAQELVLTIQPISETLASISFTPDTVQAGATATGTITLQSPAPAAGVTVELFSTNPTAASVPETVTVPFNQTSVDFDVTTHAVTVTSHATIRARLAGVSLFATTPVGVTVNADVT